MIKTLSQRLLGPVTLVLLALTFWLGLWVTPPDKVQGNLARLLYVHPAIAWVALYVSFGTAAIASGLRSILPGLGISTLRAGSGRHVPARSSLASSPSSRVTPSTLTPRSAAIWARLTGCL